MPPLHASLLLHVWISSEAQLLAHFEPPYLKSCSALQLAGSSWCLPTLTLSPSFNPDELPAETAGLRWHQRPGPATPALGVERADLLVGGEMVATVAIGWEPDPYSVPLIETARRSGAKVVLRHVGGTDELGASVAGAYEPGTSLLEIVRDLRAETKAPIVSLIATRGEGVAELVAVIDDHHRADSRDRRVARARAQILSMAQTRLRAHPDLDRLAESVVDRHDDPYTAAEGLLS